MARLTLSQIFFLQIQILRWNLFSLTLTVFPEKENNKIGELFKFACIF